MMNHRLGNLLAAGLISIGLTLPGAAHAYDNKDAIRDCENRIRTEYGISDLRDARAEQIMDGDKHFKVQGLAKVDNKKHPWTCEIKARHLVAAEYSGPKTKSMSTTEKLAIGAAAAVAIGIAANATNKDGSAGTSPKAGAAGLQDLVGARASSGETQLMERGYVNVGGSKQGASSYTTWHKGSACVMVRTEQGRYQSLVDAPGADCQ